MPCAICKTAKARRFCPGVHDEICSACCGREREETIDCPLTCEYLAEAHKHEKKPARDPEDMPGKDVPIDDEFLHTNEFLIVLVGSAISEVAGTHPNVLDADVVTALDSLAAAWKSRVAGIIFETKPVNPIAADIFEGVDARVAEIRERMRKADSEQSLPDQTVLGVLTFLQRVAFGVNNGRAKCKAFLEFLMQFYVDMKKEEETDTATSVIL